VDAVAGADRVIEPLEHDDAAALAHHEAVGPRVERKRSAGREGTDLGKLHVGMCGHFRVDAAGDHEIAVAKPQGSDPPGHRRQRRRAGGVDGFVEAMQVERRGDAAGDQAADLPRQRVLVDQRRRMGGVEPVPEPGDRRALRSIASQRLHPMPQAPREHGLHASLHEFSRDGGDHDTGPLAVEGPREIAGVVEGTAGTDQCQLLVAAHLPGDGRGNPEVGEIQLGQVVADDGTETRRRAEGDAPLGGMEDSRLPRPLRQFAHETPLPEHVAKVLRDRRRAGKDSRQADDRDRRSLRLARPRFMSHASSSADVDRQHGLDAAQVGTRTVPR